MSEINPIPDTPLSRRIKNFCQFVGRDYFETVRYINVEVRKSQLSAELITNGYIDSFVCEAYATTGIKICEDEGNFYAECHYEK